MHKTSNLSTIPSINMNRRNGCVSQFTIDSKLASGGTSAVYLASSGQEKLAVKLVKISDDERKFDVNCLLNEIQIFNRITTHPNIIGFEGTIDVCEIADSKYIGYGMRLALTNLSAMVITSSEFLKAIAGACRGLQSLHDQNLIHADFKSKNVLIDENTQPKLADFGLVTPIGSTIYKEKEPGDIVGTLSYLAPERIWGDSPAAIPMDVYSVGMSLLRFFNPNQWECEDRAAFLLEFHALEDKCTHLIPGYMPPQVLSIIHRCLYKNPNLRYQNMAELIEDLTHASDLLNGCNRMAISTTSSDALTGQQALDDSTPLPIFSVYK